MESKKLGPNSGFDTLKTEMEKQNPGEERDRTTTKQSSQVPWAKYAAFAAAGAISAYVVWANRERIQKFLKAQGLEIPSVDSVGEAVQSGVSKIKNVVEREARSLTSSVQSAEELKRSAS